MPIFWQELALEFQNMLLFGKLYPLLTSPIRFLSLTDLIRLYEWHNFSEVQCSSNLTNLH